MIKKMRKGVLKMIILDFIARAILTTSVIWSICECIKEREK